MDSVKARSLKPLLRFWGAAALLLLNRRSSLGAKEKVEKKQQREPRIYDVWRANKQRLIVCLRLGRIDPNYTA